MHPGCLLQHPGSLFLNRSRCRFMDLYSLLKRLNRLFKCLNRLCQRLRSLLQYFNSSVLQFGSTLYRFLNSKDIPARATLYFSSQIPFIQTEFSETLGTICCRQVIPWLEFQPSGPLRKHVLRQFQGLNRMFQYFCRFCLEVDSAQHGFLDRKNIPARTTLYFSSQIIFIQVEFLETLGTICSMKCRFRLDIF